jgi:hypothetical protein
MLSATLYQRILKESFSGLPPTLQQFHGQVEGGCAEGTVTVERGDGLLRRGLAALLRLPPPGHLPLRLEVIVEDGCERWIRHFGNYCLDTLQWQEGSLLIEKAGLLQFGFRLIVEDSALVFQQHFCRLGKLLLPHFATLFISATVSDYDQGWQVEVVISAPIFGVITTYHGEVYPHIVH